MAKATWGFTLIEILIGLAVLGVLAVSAIPSMSSVLNKQTLKAKVSRLDTYVRSALTWPANLLLSLAWNHRRKCSVLLWQASAT